MLLYTLKSQRVYVLNFTLISQQIYHTTTCTFHQQYLLRISCFSSLGCEFCNIFQLQTSEVRYACLPISPSAWLFQGSGHSMPPRATSPFWQKPNFILKASRHSSTYSSLMPPFQLPLCGFFYCSVEKSLGRVIRIYGLLRRMSMTWGAGGSGESGKKLGSGADSAKSCLPPIILSMALHQTSIKNLSSPFFFSMLEMFQTYKGEKIAQLTYIISGMWFWEQCELHLTLTPNSSVPPKTINNSSPSPL